MICPDATSVTINTKKIDDVLDKMVVGGSYDFDKDKLPKETQNATFWRVYQDSDADENNLVANTRTGIGSDIMDKNGVFTPNKAGKYVIVVECRRSSTATEIRGTTDRKEVAVGVGFDVIQDTSNSFIVEFPEDMTNKVNSSNFTVENTKTHYEPPVKEATANGNTVTVKMFTDFTDGEEYNVTYKNGAVTGNDTFTASVGTVDHITVDTTEIIFNDPQKIEYTLYDAAGIKLNNVSLRDNITITATGVSADGVLNGYLNGNNGDYKLVLFNEGDKAVITVEYHAGYDETGTEIIKTGIGYVTAVNKTLATLKTVTYTLGDTDPGTKEAWAQLKPEKEICVGESKHIYMYIGGSDGNKLDVTPTYESSDSKKLVVNADGSVHAIVQGTAYIIATFTLNGETVPYPCEITIKPERKATSMLLDTYSVMLSNASAADDSKTVKVTVNDQYGNPMKLSALTVELLQSSAKGAPTEPTNVTDAKTGSVTFKGEGATDATYTYKITATAEDGNSLSRTVTVTVKAPSGKNTTFKFVPIPNPIDITVSEATDKGQLLSGYPIKVGKYEDGVLAGYATSSDVTISLSVIIQGKSKTVTSRQDTVWFDAGDGTGTFKPSQYNPVTCEVIKPNPGISSVIYQFTAKTKNDDRIVDTMTVRVVDNQKPPVVGVKGTYPYHAPGTVEEVIGDCISLPEGCRIVNANIVDGTGDTISYDGEATVTVGQELSIKSLDVMMDIGNCYKLTFKIPMSINAITIR